MSDFNRRLEEARTRGERWSVGRRACGYRQASFSPDDAARLVQDLVRDLAPADADEVVWAVVGGAARAYGRARAGAA